MKVCVVFLLLGFSNLILMASQPVAGETVIVEASEVDWQKLNPARGDQSPQAATLWGDRNGGVPTGFLAKFVDGFSSPPHIHNVTYRAVVISGEIHNDDPEAAMHWMPTGSFWTQPKGEVHITAARGSSSIALVEIDHGPYLVQPSDEASDSGERPINIDASNVVWVDPPAWPASAKGPKVAYLWGRFEDGAENGSFVKLPAGFRGELRSNGSIFRAVVIKGLPNYQDKEGLVLEPGSYIGSSGETVHPLSSSPDSESVLYIRTNGPYEIVASE